MFDRGHSCELLREEKLSPCAPHDGWPLLGFCTHVLSLELVLVIDIFYFPADRVACLTFDHNKVPRLPRPLSHL